MAFGLEAKSLSFLAPGAPRARKHWRSCARKSRRDSRTAPKWWHWKSARSRIPGWNSQACSRTIRGSTIGCSQWPSIDSRSKTTPIDDRDNMALQLPQGLLKVLRNAENQVKDRYAGPVLFGSEQQTEDGATVADLARDVGEMVY